MAEVRAMDRRSEERRAGWAFFWLALGAGTLVAMIAAPEMPQWSIVTLLVFVGVCFTASAYYFRLFVAPIPIGTIPRGLIIVAIISIGMFMLYQRLGPQPRITFLETQVYTDRPNLPLFANVSFQNTGARGKMTGYSVGALTLTSIKTPEARRTLKQLTEQLIKNGGGLTYHIGAQEQKWFTIFGPTPTQQQSLQMKNAELDFYFFATMITDPGNEKFDYCSYVVANRPNVVLECEE